MTKFQIEKLLDIWRSDIIEYDLLGGKGFLVLELGAVSKKVAYSERHHEDILVYGDSDYEVYNVHYSAWFANEICTLEDIGSSKVYAGTITVRLIEKDILIDDYEILSITNHSVDKEGDLLDEYMEYIRYNSDFLDIFSLTNDAIRNLNVKEEIESFLLEFLADAISYEEKSITLSIISDKEKNGKFQSFILQDNSELSDETRRAYTFLSAGELYWLKITLLDDFQNNSDISIEVELVMRVGKPVRISKFKGKTIVRSKLNESQHGFLEGIGSNIEFVTWLNESFIAYQVE